MFVCWTAFYEGKTDNAYFEVLLPRLIENIVQQRAPRNVSVPAYPAIPWDASDKSIDTVSNKICETMEAFDIVFIHADTGGAAQQASLPARSTSFCEACLKLCEFPPVRCVPLTPKHETEAWVLTDRTAICDALGFRGNPDKLDLPKNAKDAEKDPDPKSTLNSAVKKAIGKRRRLNPTSLFPIVASTQNLVELRKTTSFREFEKRLVAALEDVGCID